MKTNCKATECVKSAEADPKVVSECGVYSGPPFKTTFDEFKALTDFCIENGDKIPGSSCKWALCYKYLTKDCRAKECIKDSFTGGP